MPEHTANRAPVTLIYLTQHAFQDFLQHTKKKEEKKRRGGGRMGKEKKKEKRVGALTICTIPCKQKRSTYSQTGFLEREQSEKDKLQVKGQYWSNLQIMCVC